MSDPISMLSSLRLVQAPGGIAAKESTKKNVKYTKEYKLEALALVDSLGSRNKAARALGISTSLLGTFHQHKQEGRF